MKLFVKYETFGSLRSNSLTERVNDYLRSFNGTLLSDLDLNGFHKLLASRVSVMNMEHPRLKPISLDMYDNLKDFNTARISCEVSGACLRIFAIKQEL